MQNKIPCSAERLGLLDPKMIQAVSEASAFQIAQQYLTENRVRIVEADDAQITSAVIGNSGLYEQTVRLKDGHLLSKCSCTLSEQLMCRHCIAVLLEYHRWVQPKQSQKPGPLKESQPPTQAAAFVSRRMATSESSVADLKLSDLMQFMEWLPSATRAIQTQGQLPDPPQFESAEVSTWIHTIRTLAENRRENDQAATRLKAEMRDRESHVQRLTLELQISMDETKAAQMTTEELRLKIATHEETLAKVDELATDIVTYEEQMRLVASDLLQKGSQFEKLAGAVKESAQTLKAIAKPTLQES
jgi:hypothetical protein